MVRMAVLPTDKATVTENGIKFKGLFYSSDRAVREVWFEKVRSKKKWWQVVSASQPFVKVQTELARRATLQRQSKKTSETYRFTGKIVCGHCGRNYRRKTANAGTPYEKVVWICNTFNTMGKTACPSRQIPENILKEIVDMDFTKIRVSESNKIIIVKPNGSEIEKECYSINSKERD